MSRISVTARFSKLIWSYLGQGKIRVRVRVRLGLGL